jgi:MFS family permease
MHVTLFGFVLFLHILTAIVAFMMAAIVHAGLPALARARDVREMRSWAAILHRLEPLFPIAALVLLLLGAWLVHLSNGDIHWGDGWLLTSLITLIVIEGVAGAKLAPKAKAAVKAVEEAADGPVPDSVRRTALEPWIWYPSHVATFGFAAVVFLMAAKPSGAWAVVIVIVGVLIGVAVARLQLRALSAPVAVAGTSRPAEAVQ